MSKPRIFTRVCFKHNNYLFASIWSRSLLTVLTFSNCILKPFNAEAFMIIKYSIQNTERRKSHVTLTVFHDLFVGWKTLDRVKRYVDHRVPLHVHVAAPAPWMEGFPPFPPNCVVPILPLVSCPCGALSKLLVSTSIRGRCFTCGSRHPQKPQWKWDCSHFHPCTTPIISKLSSVLCLSAWFGLLASLASSDYKNKTV